MNKLWIAATLGAALALAGCTSVYDKSVSYNAAMRVVDDNFCKKLPYDSALAILRGKIPLYGNYRTAAMLNDGTKPNDAERQALEVYLQGVTECANEIHKAVDKYQTKKQIALSKAQELQGYILLWDLKAGILSWGDFNRRDSINYSEGTAAFQSSWDERQNDERKTKALLSALGQGLAQGAQQYGNAISRAYAPQQQNSSSYAPAPAYEPATTWTSHGNIVQGSNGVTMQTFGNNSTITYPNGQTRSCYTSGTITTCSSPPGF